MSTLPHYGGYLQIQTLFFDSSQLIVSLNNSNKGDDDLGSNANKEAVHKAQLENRERCKAASQAKKDKDKEDREKQKKDAEDRKKKAQDKSAKVERKR